MSFSHSRVVGDKAGLKMAHKQPALEDEELPGSYVYLQSAITCRPPADASGGDGTKRAAPQALPEAQTGAASAPPDKRPGAAPGEAGQNAGRLRTSLS